VPLLADEDGVMAWRRFSAGGLTIDVQFGDPTLLVVIGNVYADRRSALREALEAAAGWPGSPNIEVNLVLARFQDDVAWSDLLAAQKSCKDQGRRFTMTFGGRAKLAAIN
jgi:hypothetical protein